MFTVFHQLQTLVDFFDHGAAVRGVEDVERCNCVFDGSGRWRVNGRPTCGKFPSAKWCFTMLYQLNFSSTCWNSYKWVWRGSEFQAFNGLISCSMNHSFLGLFQVGWGRNWRARFATIAISDQKSFVQWFFWEIVHTVPFETRINQMCFVWRPHILDGDWHGKRHGELTGNQV